jgi:kinesin family member 2/24
VFFPADACESYQSGTPAISSGVLAPFESGRQLLRLPAPEFESRCLRTDGVSPEHAKSFRSKLWQKHVDSQKPLGKRSAKDIKPSHAYESTDALVSSFAAMDRSSSRDLDPESAGVPFKERIRAGMVVKWNRPQGFDMPLAPGILLAVVLCPVHAMEKVPSSAFHLSGATNTSSGKGQFLCAAVQLGVMPEAYTIDLWRQFVLDVEWMESEMILEYDSATRYYYLAI